MLIIAHRGASGEAPENTLAAFNLAWQQNADGIELDVHLSRDGQVMVHHDASTKRLTDANLAIADTSSAVLRQLDLGCWKGPRFAGQRMPLLEEVLATVPTDKRVVIEVKSSPAIAPNLAQILTSSGYLEKLDISLISFNLETLLVCQQHLPNLPCFLLDEVDPEKRLGFSEQLIKLALQHGFAGLDLDYKGLTKTFAAQVRQAGLRLLSWTVNDTSYIPHLQACQVEAITTDWPLQFLTAVQTPS